MIRLLPRLALALAVALGATPVDASDAQGRDQGSDRGSDRRAAAEAEPCLATATAGCYAAVHDRRARASDGTLTAPGSAAGGSHDRHGNAVDRRGRILAVPASPGRPAEVFVDD